MIVKGADLHRSALILKRELDAYVQSLSQANNKPDPFVYHRCWLKAMRMNKAKVTV